MSGHVHFLYSDTMLGTALQRQVQSAYFHVTGGQADDLDDAIAKVRANQPEVIALVRGQGTDLNHLRGLKHAFPNQSLVLVDPIPSPSSRERSLSLGADMYLPLPASSQQIAFRLRCADRAAWRRLGQRRTCCVCWALSRLRLRAKIGGSMMALFSFAMKMMTSHRQCRLA